MKLSFKNLHRLPGKSKKDGAFMGYTATVLVDGVPVFTAKNDGKGGDDVYVPLKGMRERYYGLCAWAVIREWENVVNYVRACLMVDIAKRDLAKLMAHHAVFLRDGKIEKIKLVDGNSMSEVRQYLKRKFPKAVLLNTLDEEKALGLYMTRAR